MSADDFIFLFVIMGIIIAEMGGIGFIIWNHKFSNPKLMRKYGVFLCIMGIIGFIWGVIGLYLVK